MGTTTHFQRKKNLYWGNKYYKTSARNKQARFCNREMGAIRLSSLHEHMKILDFGPAYIEGKKQEKAGILKLHLNFTDLIPPSLKLR